MNDTDDADVNRHNDNNSVIATTTLVRCSRPGPSGPCARPAAAAASDSAPGNARRRRCATENSFATETLSKKKFVRPSRVLSGVRGVRGHRVQLPVEVA